MSIESAKAFLERMKNDEDFRKEVGEKSSPEDRMNFIKENGFDFSKEDIEQVKSELSEEELEGAAGSGSGYATILCGQEKDTSGLYYYY